MPPASSFPPCLPALSVVLGLPLSRRRENATSAAAATDHNTTRGTFNQDADDAELVTSLFSTDCNNNTSSPKQSAAFNQRVTNNIARIYARRVINKARLEREHPYYCNKSSPTSTDTGAPSQSQEVIDLQQQLEAAKRHKITSSSGIVDRDWKDELLSETLQSLLKLQDKIDKVKSFTSNASNDDISQLNQLGLSIGGTRHLIAQCESSSAKQRTLDDYNALQAVAATSPTSTAKNNSSKAKPKPKEWNDDIDLVQRRLEFGKEISPLSNTSRFQRWSMACKRIVTLGMLAAPLGVLVPCNVVLGKVAGKKKRRVGSEGCMVSDGTKMTAEEEDDVLSKQQQSQLSKIQHYHKRLTTATWDYALWAIESAGPTYIKLVQWASTRNDLFSPEFIGHFSKLQDETRGHTWKETEATLYRAYGPNWKNILSFDKIIDDGDDDYDEDDSDEGIRLKQKGGQENRERQKRLLARNETKSTNGGSKSSKSSSSASTPTIPIGSGCVAQVYKARLTKHHGLHPPGTSVAVKVQHPQILEKVCLDFYIFNKLASALEYIPYLNLDYLSMKDSVDQFRDIMLPQLDLRVEAHNLQRFRRDFEGESQIAFPEPIVELTTREVLIERFVEGEPMLNYVLKEDELHSKKDREELATIGLETVMKMIFLHDFVHADLHPGNMIVDRNKSVRGNPIRMHMIDCGLTVELGERDHMNLVKILGSLIKRDGYAAGKLMVDTAKKCQATELDVEMFCNGIEKICIDDEENNFLESVGDYITDICYLACKHKVKLEAAFINAALACEIMEGLASSLYPEMAVQRIALPMVLKAEMMHGLKGLPTPRLSDWSWSKKE